MNAHFNRPSLDEDFESLSRNPLTNEQMHQFKEALLVPHHRSRKNRNIVSLLSVALSVAFLATLSPAHKEYIEFIDFLLVGAIAWGAGYLVWGWIDDLIFKRHQIILRIDGAIFQRRAYESLREKTSFWDSDNISDIPIPDDAEDVRRYIDNVLHGIGRGFVRFDREIINNALAQKR